MPTPTSSRPVSSTASPLATAESSAPVTNTVAVISRIGRRPCRSASRPANAAPTAAPASAMLVTTPCIRLDR